MRPLPRLTLLSLAVTTLALQGCWDDDDESVTTPLPQLSEATGTTLPSCTDLATRISFANTTITGATPAPPGPLTSPASPVAAHSRVTGRMFDRTSPVDGRSYAIGFEMRLPNN